MAEEIHGEGVTPTTSVITLKSSIIRPYLGESADDLGDMFENIKSVAEFSAMTTNSESLLEMSFREGSQATFNPNAMPNHSLNSALNELKSGSGLSVAKSQEVGSPTSAVPSSQSLKTVGKDISQILRNVCNLPKMPISYMNLERLRGVDKYDVYSEDEEPVMKTKYSPYVHEPECVAPVVKEEHIIKYDVQDGAPYKRTDQTFTRKLDNTRRYRVSLGGLTSKRSARSEALNCDLISQDVTPHQRDLTWVSYDELSPRDVAILLGLWKCITFDIYTFGVQTSINIIKVASHSEEKYQTSAGKAEKIALAHQQHSDLAMETLENIVLNLQCPVVAHKLIYELARDKWQYEVPRLQKFSQMVINGFLFTFAQHVHPKLTLMEINLLRKFCNITMFLFVDGSNWNLTPMIPT